MNDEEMAEEYAEKYFGKKTELVEVWKLKSCKDNFLAGLKAGRPQWHKENPKVSMPLILIRYRCHIDNEIYVALGKYDADYGGNKFQSDYWNVFDDEVIAWCEIPTFDKE